MNSDEQVWDAGEGEAPAVSVSQSLGDTVEVESTRSVDQMNIAGWY